MKECLIKNMGVNCFIAFSFFVFAPLEIYLTNQSSFWFSLRPLLIYAVCMFIIVYSICTVLDFINKKCVNWFKGFAWGVSIALYIQGNFLNGNYGTLDGNPINWKSGFLMSYRIIDIVAWLIIIGLCWFIFIKRHEIAQIIGICLVVTQLITVGILIIGGIQEKSQINATTQHEFEYSADSNVIVVCADGFDSVF